MSDAAGLRRVHEQLELAVCSIANGGSTVIDRLEGAWAAHLADLEPDRLPEALRSDFVSLRSRMQARLATGRLLMPEQEGIDTVKRLLAIRLAVARLSEETQQRGG